MGRDIHLVPVEFFYSDPNMLRQYGDRVILFNMHRPETREAFRSARETPNGYTLVNEDISTDHIEAVYALEKTGWEFPWTPRTQPRFCDAQGVNVAQNMCSYFSHCYVISNNVDFNDLEPPLRNAVIDAGQYYAGLLLKDFFKILQTDDVPKKITKFKKIRNLQKSKKMPLKKNRS